MHDPAPPPPPVSAGPEGHTPGPWRALGGRVIALVDEREVGVAGTKSVEFHSDEESLVLVSEDEARANARLIAAAPALLATCERLEARLTACARAFYGAGKASDLRAAFGGWKDDIEPARSAIAAARGEPEGRGDGNAT